jgi:hypothetical protein
MIKVSCRYLSLSELPETFDTMAYQTMVRPLEYEFSLSRNSVYLVIALLVRKGTTWLYIVLNGSDEEIYFVPAALFSFIDTSIPLGMNVKTIFNPDESFEILPVSLSKIKDWFERYVDGDAQIVEMVKSEILKLSLTES